jgi:hypothetical protein
MGASFFTMTADVRFCGFSLLEAIVKKLNRVVLIVVAVVVMVLSAGCDRYSNTDLAGTLEQVGRDVNGGPNGVFEEIGDRVGSDIFCSDC